MTTPVVKVESLLGLITIKLRDDNFAKWAFPFKAVLKGHKLFEHFEGTNVCPPKFIIHTETGVTNEITQAYIEWESTDMALLSLLLATLSDEAMEYVIGCRTAHEAWSNLVERYASVSKSRVNHLKTELHTIQKGSDSIDKYLMRLKNIRDQLSAAGEFVSDNDVMIAGLAGLPKEYAIIRTVILARESSITLKEFKAQLLGAEKEIEGEITLLTQNMSAMYSHGSSSTTGSTQGSGSTSNPIGHCYIPATTGGVITPGSHNLSSNQSAGQHFVDPYIPHLGYPLIPPSAYFPPLPYGFGFVGNANPGARSNGSNGFHNGANSFSGSQYRGNNNFRSGGYNGKHFNSGASRQNSNSGWSGNTQSKTNVVIECQICSKRGHTAANCFQRNTNAPVNGFMVECQICGKKGHGALECFHRGNYAYQGQPPSSNLNDMTAQHTSQFNPNDAWVVDTGATHHMTADVNSLTQVQSFKGSDKIIVGNGTDLDIKNIGSASIRTNDYSLVLKHVLHVPKIAKSLLSVKQLCADNTSWFICDESQFFV